MALKMVWTYVNKFYAKMLDKSSVLRGHNN